jgi:hypothetical protein
MVLTCLLIAIVGSRWHACFWRGYSLVFLLWHLLRDLLIRLPLLLIIRLWVLSLSERWGLIQGYRLLLGFVGYAMLYSTELCMLLRSTIHLVVGISLIMRLIRLSLRLVKAIWLIIWLLVVPLHHRLALAIRSVLRLLFWLSLILIRGVNLSFSMSCLLRVLNTEFRTGLLLSRLLIKPLQMLLKLLWMLVRMELLSIVKLMIGVLLASWVHLFCERIYNFKL